MKQAADEQYNAINHLDRSLTLSRKRVLLWAALLLAMGLALWVQWPRLTNSSSYQDDFRGYYWFNLFQEPDLYPADHNPTTYRNTEIQFLGVEVGLLFDIVNNLRGGYHLLYFVVSPLISPNLFNKLLIFPLALFTTYYAFRIGQKLKGEWIGFALAMTLVVFNLAADDTISIASGLPRSFAFPILLAVIYYLMIQQYLAAGFFVAVAGIVYAPVFVLSLATFILAVLESIKSGRIRVRFDWKIIVSLMILGVASLIIIPKVTVIVSLFWDRLFANSAAWGLLSDPTYRPGGKYPLLEVEYPFVGRGGVFTRIGPFWQAMVLIIMAMGTWLLVPRQERVFPKVLRQLLIAGVACFAFAWAAIVLASALTLYYPSRYLRATLPLVALIFTFTNLEQALSSARTRFTRLAPPLRITLFFLLTIWTVSLAFLLRSKQDIIPFLNSIPTQRLEWLLIFASAFLIGALLLFIFGSVETGQEHVKLSGFMRFVTILLICLFAFRGAFYIIGPDPVHNYLTLSPSHEDYLDFVQTLPKDVKLASGACVLENIPMYAKRQVLWDCEDSLDKSMVIDTLRAYFAPSLDMSLNFCHQYGVDYFVIDNKAFDEDRIRAGLYFFEPFNSILNAEITPEKGFALDDIPDSLRVYDQENVIVMQCNPDNIGKLDAQATQVDGLSGTLVHDELSDTLSQASGFDTIIKWTADKEMLADYDVCFTIKDSSGVRRQKVCEPLSPDLPTSQWSIPEIRYETYNVEISPYLERGDYSIVASLDLAEERDRSSDIVIGEFEYTTLPRTFHTAEIDPESEYDIIWGDTIALADYDVVASDPRALGVNVRLHALQRMSDSYKVFVHLRRVDTNEIVGQVDAIPKNWTYPTNWWEENEIISDTLSIQLGDLEPGRYELWLGLYNVGSGERLPLTAPGESNLITKGEAVKIYVLE